jgi:Cd(II)/Pb(II)-responsive transcriptional regulator
MRIGELSSATGVDVETIRYYEREGLLRQPERTASRYRSYQSSDVDELKFIRHCRSLGISLAETKGLQNFRWHPERACAEINVLVDTHIELVQQRIQQLHELARQLLILRRSCEDARTADTCGILRSLSAAAAEYPT